MNINERKTAIYFRVREKHLCTENYWEWVQESSAERAPQDSGIYTIFSSLSWIYQGIICHFIRLHSNELNVFSVLEKPHDIIKY